MTSTPTAPADLSDECRAWLKAYWGQPWHNIVLALCEEHGFGAVMQSASEQWRQRDPIGAISLGPCFGSINPRPPRMGPG